MCFYVVSHQFECNVEKDFRLVCLISVSVMHHVLRPCTVELRVRGIFVPRAYSVRLKQTVDIKATHNSWL